MSAPPPPPPPPPLGIKKPVSASGPPPPPPPPGTGAPKVGGVPPPPPSLGGFKPKKKNVAPPKQDKPKAPPPKPKEMVAPAGGMSLMDELAKKFKKSNQQKEISFGDDEPVSKPSKDESIEETKGEIEQEKVSKRIVPSGKNSLEVPSSHFALPKKDEKGGLSVRDLALGETKIDLNKIPETTIEDTKSDESEDEETKSDLDFLMEKRKEKQIKYDKEEDKEDEESIQNIRKSKDKKAKHKSNSTFTREQTIQDSEEFLKNDQASYSSSVWAEIINEEGDKVWLNRITGEIAMNKPDEKLGVAMLAAGMQAQTEEVDDGTWRWLPDKQEAWIPSRFMKNKPNGKYEYQDIEGITFSISEKMHKRAIPMIKKSLQNYVHDLLMLDEVNEAIILYNIKNRFEKKRIYTRLGKILISVNPYKLYPLYTPEVIEKYQNARTVSQLPPHVYEIAKLAFEELEKTKHPQSILIAGESGSGKTEACKQWMQFLAEVAGSETNMEKRLLDCNPILESLGNAQTVRNDNSSRFGKWSEIYFDENGKIVSGKITDYLLEKSRVSHQEKGERNYHIFYQICRGLSPQQKEQFCLLNVEDYTYLTQSGKDKIKGVDDSVVFNETYTAMTDLLGQDKRDQIFRILSAILLMGNLKLKDNQDDSTSIEFSSKGTVAKIWKLLDIDSDKFEEYLVTKRSMAGTTEIVSNMRVEKAEEAKHGLARLLYQRLFQNVVSIINLSIVNPDASRSSLRRYVGILDIYGFEIFKHNSFEQFCINYANEKLQQHFVKYTFKTEEKMYEDDGIEFEKINYKDNIMILEVIEDKTTGIISILDDELRIPKSSDERLIGKIDAANKDKAEVFARHFKTKELFTIMHFAGDVDYNINGFVEKNRDQTSGNMKGVMQDSGLELVQTLFPPEESTKNKAIKSLAYQFRSQLNSLMITLEDTNPYYIKCIKPNHQKSSSEFDPPLVLDQLKSTRIVESLEIVQKGYPYRLTYKAFADRYKCINPNYKGNIPKKAVELILSKLNYDISRFKQGHSYVHYKSEDNRFLEMQRNVNIDRLITKVQNYRRMINAKRLLAQLKKYKKICEAALKDGTLPVIEAALAKGEDIRFVIKEHSDLKKLAFKLREEDELKKELMDLERFKKEKDLDKLRDMTHDLIDRADHIGYSADQLELIRKMYERANEITQIRNTLMRALDGFVDIEALRAAIARARKLDEIPEDLIEKAHFIFVKFEKEIELFRAVLNSFATGCPTDVKEAYQQIEYEHIEPLLHEFRLSQPFYNKDIFNQHLLEFEIMLNMRKAVRSEDFVKLQSCLIRTFDVTQNQFFQSEIDFMNEVVAHYGEVEKIKEHLWIAIDKMDLQTIRYWMDQGDIYKINWDTVAREDDGVHQACTFDAIRQSVIAEATVAVNVMEKEIMNRWYNTLWAFKINNDVTKALKHLLTEINAEKFDYLAFKAAMHLKDEKLIIWRTIKVKEHEFVGDKNMEKWVLSSCHLLQDPEEWASTVGFFKSKKEKAKGFYFHQEKNIHQGITKGLGKDQNKKAVLVFKNILGFTGDKSVPYPHMCGTEVLLTGITHPDLRDEIYAQLLKQLLNNKNDVSRLRLYKLIILCLEWFAPAQMENYIDFFLRKKMKNPTKLLYLLYERWCIQPVRGFSRDELEKMVKNAKKPEDLPEVDEYLPAYTALSHPTLASYKA